MISGVQYKISCSTWRSHLIYLLKIVSSMNLSLKTKLFFVFFEKLSSIPSKQQIGIQYCKCSHLILVFFKQINLTHTWCTDIYNYQSLSKPMRNSDQGIFCIPQYTRIVASLTDAVLGCTQDTLFYG